MTPEEHQQLRERLPWYANGTLAPAEAGPLRAHLEGCAGCRDELARCLRLAEGLQSRDEPAWAPSAAGFARLMATIDASERAAEPRRGASGLERLREALGAWLGGSPPPVRWALAAQAALIVVLGAAWVAPTPDPVYRTLSDPAPGAPAPGALLRVVFSDQITEREWRELLLAVGGRIVQGPSALGVYTVAVAPAGAAEALARLQSHPLVRLAEPVQPQERP
jgi:anti-sigma factor RsiW